MFLFFNFTYLLMKKFQAFRFNNKKKYLKVVDPLKLYYIV